MKIFTILFISLFLFACSSPDSARKVLNESGFTNIETTGYEIFACGKDDYFSTGFYAKGVSGLKVHGVVCSGFLKGSTIRIF